MITLAETDSKIRDKAKNPWWSFIKQVYGFIKGDKSDISKHQFLVSRKSCLIKYKITNWFNCEPTKYQVALWAFYPW